MNGRTALLGESADPARDDIRVDGEALRAERVGYWLLHKPRGVLSTTRDPHARRGQTVLALLPKAARALRLYPVGRLDLESEGLLLLTNDGAVTQALLHPALGTEKEYRVTVRGAFDAASARRLARGPRLDDGPMAPCRVGTPRFDAARNLSHFTLTLREGRKRQIRRALRALGRPVLALQRTRMGPLQLGRLPPGAARELTSRERARLLAHVVEVMKRASRVPVARKSEKLL